MAGSTRVPKFSAFIVTGAVIGLLLGLWLATRGGGATPGYDTTSAPGYIGLMFAGLGAIVGALVAVALDSVANRRR